MKIAGIYVGQPREVRQPRRTVTTSIFKQPVAGPVWIRRHNVDGDRQADPSVHGGEFKAVYAYSVEDYDWWRSDLGGELEPAHFGENLLLEGVDLESLAIGDVLRVARAELEATSPRLPCYKLGIRFGDPGMVKRFAQAGRFGVYFRVLEEGPVAVGDAVEIVRRHALRVPVYDLARWQLRHPGAEQARRRLLGHPDLDPSWRRALEGE